MESEHFKLWEFRCKDGTEYPEEWRKTRLPALLRLLEAIRHKVGDHPITVLCGYRTPSYNAKLRERGMRGESGKSGVAEHSQHMEGRAADICCHGMRTMVFYGHIVEAYEKGLLHDLGGLGLYESMGFVHVDTYRLASGHLRRWGG
jgi:uncharacterized protein YcbK (DUF882 family)